jgi:hypothetical protein
MIKITSVRDAINVRRNATNVNRAKCRSGLAGLLAALVFMDQPCFLSSHFPGRPEV